MNMQLSHATRYFWECWSDLFDGVGSRRSLLKLFNAHAIIKELQDEMTYNDLLSANNRNFFRSTLGNYLKTDPGLEGVLRIHVREIIKEFDNYKRRPGYMKELCRSALRLFRDGTYFGSLLSSLKGMTALETLGPAEKARVKAIANNMIVEFRNIGLTDDDIRPLPGKLFNSPVPFQGHVLWNFPHGIPFPENADEPRLAEYRKNLIAFDLALGENARIDAFSKFFNNDVEESHFIFGIDGLDVEETIMVSGVEFYSPSKNPRVVREATDGAVDSELFHFGPRRCATNALVHQVSKCGRRSAADAARNRVQKALSVLRRLRPGAAPIMVSKSYVVIDPEGRINGASTHTFERAEDDITKKFIINAEFISQHSTHLNDLERGMAKASAHGFSSKVDDALYWLRRAEESYSPGERLLSYWISLETLCSKPEKTSSNWFATNEKDSEENIDVIVAVVGKARAVTKAYEYGWTLRQQVMVANMNNGGRLIPPDLLVKAGFAHVPGEMITLRSFIDALGDLATIDLGELMNEQVEDLRSFYVDTKMALRKLAEFYRDSADEVNFVYRMRNKIAHDGNSEHPLLEFVSAMAGDYTHVMFSRIMEAFSHGDCPGPASALIGIAQNYDMMEKRLEDGEPVHQVLGL